MQRTASETLRAAIVLDDRPVHRIARTANVPPTVLSRFMRRERGMTIQSLDRVAAAVGLELRPRGVA